MKRKAQGAIEYLFMIAAALVIVLIVWRQISGRGSKASEIADTAENQISSELQQEIGG
ncbi:class III signal peptide-containing protein [Thermococcus sp. MV11]|uniref:class III signal peptide-containing protein n=1 Tax=Thermococcus sp. MV11 TaxID=1638267 RepID=UPI001430AB8C|nr:class III signal peptide-containing protein [Thermococcus sp. MV11]NJE03269.1 class III signal peptide-containing protein [Thermococcus sp. MV11]